MHNPYIRSLPETRMRTNAFVILAVATIGQTLAPPVVLGQGPTVSAARSALSTCPYELCALRVEPGFFGGRKLVSGEDGVRTNFGLVGDGLIGIVNGVPAALSEAKLGRRNSVKSTIAGVVAGLGLVAALNATVGANIDKVSDGRFFAACAVGAVAGVTATTQFVFAQRHFSRSIWLYTRELKR